jgi:hypothetical protein
MERVIAELDLYLVLYLATLALHLALVSFPLGGSALLCLFEIFRGEEVSNLREIISDHLAISIGLAITAGVAPLLFLELVHPHAFYAAGTILGAWRPAVIVPVAIAFYLAYLQKTATFRRLPGIARLPLRLGGLAALCAAAGIFTIGRRVGEDADRWREMYADLPLEALAGAALPFLGLVLAAATVGCAVWTLWLLGRAEARGRLSPGQRFAAEETLLRLAIPVAIGLLVACEVLRAQEDRPIDLGWWCLRGSLAATIAGFSSRLHRVGPGRLIATIGSFSALAVALLLREEQRWVRLGESLHAATREIAATRGGIEAFIASAVIAAAGILAALQAIRRAPAPSRGDGETIEETR